MARRISTQSKTEMGPPSKEVIFFTIAGVIVVIAISRYQKKAVGKSGVQDPLHFL